jgi:hypothetical protein
MPGPAPGLTSTASGARPGAADASPRVKILIFALDPGTFLSSPKERAPPRFNFATWPTLIFNLKHFCPFRFILYWKRPEIDKLLNSVR